MKFSNYNILKNYDNRYYIINTFHSTFLEISEEEYNLLLNNNFIDLSSSLKSKLQNFGMLIDETTDELQQLKTRYFEEQLRKDHLTITIAPSLRCNFACSYCYENRYGKIISEEDQSKILAFIEKQLNLGYKSFDLIWFGGEPLLTFDIIKNMSNKIIPLCDKLNVDYNAYMTTNGYLLTENIIKQLKKLKINQLFITLDGLASVHDMRRCQIDGSGTFNRIVSNIILAKKNDIDVVIRMNIDKNNEKDIENLRNFVTNNLKLPVYLGLVRQYTDSCCGDESIYFTKKEYAEILNDFYKAQENDGIVNNNFPRQLPIYCRACKVGTFVIDSDLNVFKCENNIGRSEKRISTVEDYPFNNEINNSQNKEFYDWNPFEYSQCCDCKIMPICMGGCPYIGIRDSIPECEIYKYNFDNVVKKYVLSRYSKSNN